ncbi:MAG TPA: hypothetical protein VGK58_20650 [Lacipirellulaceae bacterium]
MVKSLCYAGLFCLVNCPIALAQRVDLDDPRVEAEYLSLEISGELRPPVALADQIEADLAAIRRQHPDLSDIRALPFWMPGELLVGLTPPAYSEFKEGTFHGFDPLYAELGTPESRTHDTGQWVHLQFGQVYHGLRLAELFRPVEGVRHAEPNGIVGDGNDIVARANRTYTLSRGFGDCPAGCIYRESWDFTVTDDGVFSGTIVPQQSSDFNNDGVVDAADYVVWRKGAGSQFNATHHSEWRSHFGATNGAGSAALGAATVPEPTGCLLMTLGLMQVLLLRNWPRARQASELPV